MGTEGLSIVHTPRHDGHRGEGWARYKALIVGEGTAKGNLEHSRRNDHVRGLEASRDRVSDPGVSHISVVWCESTVVGHGEGENVMWVDRKGSGWDCEKSRSRGWGDLSLRPREHPR